MSMLERLNSLPEGADANTLRPYILELLATPVSDEADEEAATDALAELADRQWHTYELLAPDLRARVVEWIRRHWNPMAERAAMSLRFTIGALGLTECLPLLQSALEPGSNTPAAIREDIEGFLAEVGDGLGNPYSGMRRPADSADQAGPT
jgi:hypothetical protein